MKRSAFEQLVREGVQRIPDAFRGYVRDVAVVIEDEPTDHQRQALGLGERGELFGLYEGTPRTERAYLPYRLPDKITIFQGSMERATGDNPERIREEVAYTVWHELAHALGFSEARIKQLETDPPASLRAALRAGPPASLREALRTDATRVEEET
ncbi:MAG: metallopeptidase family protein [bacterium]|nr:metallopeptidase family protein [bacterium]